MSPLSCRCRLLFFFSPPRRQPAPLLLIAERRRQRYMRRVAARRVLLISYHVCRMITTQSGMGTGAAAPRCARMM